MATQTGKSTSDLGSVTLERKQSTAQSVGGTLTMSEQVVATIAGLGARETEGIHALGKPRLVRFGDSPRRGVNAEVGSREAALDLDVVIAYGYDIRRVASALRQRIADEVNRMAGREVVEVNINVVDVHLPDKEPATPSKRVR